MSLLTQVMGVITRAKAEANVYDSIKQSILEDLNLNLYSKKRVQALSQASVDKMVAEFSNPNKGWTVTLLTVNEPWAGGGVTAPAQVKYIEVK